MAKRRRHGKRRNKRRNPGATTASVSNPRRRRRKHRAHKRTHRTHKRTHARTRARRRNPGRRYAASRGPGQRKRARTFVHRNRHGRRLGHIRGWTAHRRKNPSADGILAAAIAVGVGLIATVVVGYAVDVMLASQSPAIQTSVLVAIAAGSALFLPTHPALAAGIATGLLIVPLSKQVYTWFPALANPAPLATPVVPSPTTAAAAAGSPAATLASTMVPATTAAAMSALHMGKMHPRHKQLRALHMGQATQPWQMRALHMGQAQHTHARVMNKGMQALHMRGMRETMSRGFTGR
jgi:hypothetical protein